MRTRKIALIIFYDDKKRILLQNRKNMSKTGEEWGFFGGKIEEGETPEQAIVREAKEELDFNLKNYKFIGSDKNQIDGKMILERHSFISALEDNFSKFKQMEGSGMQLFCLDEVKKLKMVPGDELVIKRLENIL